MCRGLFLSEPHHWLFCARGGRFRLHSRRTPVFQPRRVLALIHVMETLYYSRMSSPVGPLLIGMSDAALVILEFDRGLPKLVNGAEVEWRESDVKTRIVRKQLEEYFAGKRRDFDLQLDLRGTEFRKNCWEQLLSIPYGETRSYGEIARAVGNPQGSRAVGQANHYNPVAIIVPCHRVLHVGGGLGGYTGGLEIKRRLLTIEGVLPEPLDRAAI